MSWQDGSGATIFIVPQCRLTVTYRYFHTNSLSAGVNPLIYKCASASESNMIHLKAASLGSAFLAFAAGAALAQTNSTSSMSSTGGMRTAR